MKVIVTKTANVIAKQIVNAVVQTRWNVIAQKHASQHAQRNAMVMQPVAVVHPQATNAQDVIQPQHVVKIPVAVRPVAVGLLLIQTVIRGIVVHLVAVGTVAPLVAAGSWLIHNAKNGK